METVRYMVALIIIVVLTNIQSNKIQYLMEQIHTLHSRLDEQKKAYDEFYNKSFARMYLSLADGYRHLRRHERWLNHISGYPADKFPWERGNLPLENEANGVDPARLFDGANMFGFPAYKREVPVAQEPDDSGLTPKTWFTTTEKHDPIRDESVVGQPKKKKFSGKMNLINVGLETE